MRENKSGTKELMSIWVAKETATEVKIQAARQRRSVSAQAEIYLEQGIENDKGEKN